MTNPQSTDDQLKPIFVSDPSNAIMLRFALLMVPLYAAVGFTLYEYQNLSQAIAVFLYAVFIIFGLWFIRIINRRGGKTKIEFYEDFVRFFSGRGLPTDVRYSDLDFRWAATNKGKPVALLSVKAHPDWGARAVYNGRINQLDTMLLPWLHFKITGHLQSAEV